MRLPLPLLLTLPLGCTGGGKEPEQPPVSNNPPAFALVELLPAEPRAADALTVSFEAIDLDGDALTHSFQWRLDGRDVSNTTDTLPAFSAVRDQVVEVTVTISDGFAFGTPAVATVTLLNTGPVLQQPHIEPATPQLGEPLTCLAEAADDDGDSLARRTTWLVDGEPAAIDGEVLDADLERNTRVECEVMVSDGDLDSETLRSDPVWIGNSPPGSAVIALVPDPPSACLGGEVVIVQDAPDPDGDVVTYAFSWTDAQGAELCSTPVCGGGVFTPQATYTVSVTANDGGLDGVPATLEFVAVAGGETLGNGIDDDCDGLVDEWIDHAWQAQGMRFGEVQGGELGSTLAVGDVDGDGLDDLLLGEPGQDRVAVHLGADIDAWPTVVGAPRARVTAARTVSTLATGDVDGDGLDELLIGATNWDGVAGSATGGALIIAGDDLRSATLADQVSWRMEGSAANQRLGGSAAMGDVTGDGHADVIVAEPNADAPAREAGKAWVFASVVLSGARVTASDASAVLEGGARNSHFGTSVAVVGDIDGDGVDELAIGAPDADDGGTDAGVVGLWFGGGLASSLLIDADARVVGGAASGRVGVEPATSGDVDGDGYAELAVVGQSASASVMTGSIDVLDGAALAAGGVFPVSGALARITGDRSGSLLGLNGDGVALGDSDADGLADLVAGAPGDDLLLMWGGDTLAAGGALGTAQAAFLIAAEGSEQRYARYVAFADTDGDGDLELVTTAPRADVVRTDGGAAYLFAPPWGVPADAWSPDCEAADGRVYCRTPATWTNARAACQALGLDLVRLDGAVANAGAAADGATRYPPATTLGRWWIGLSDAATEGSWRWLDDSSNAGFTAWASGSPGTRTDSNCAALNAGGQGTWQDLACSLELFFICE